MGLSMRQCSDLSYRSIQKGEKNDLMINMIVGVRINNEDQEQSFSLILCGADGSSWRGEIPQ